MNGPLSNLPAQDAAPSAGAVRMARCRRRRQKGMRCLVIELHETEIEALIRQRPAPESRSDLIAVRKALYGFPEDTLRW
jgi:hypothetical protein